MGVVLLAAVRLGVRRGGRGAGARVRPDRMAHAAAPEDETESFPRVPPAIGV